MSKEGSTLREVVVELQGSLAIVDAKEQLAKLKQEVDADAELAGFRAVNEQRIYPFRKEDFMKGFVEGRNSLIAKLEKEIEDEEQRLQKANV